MLVAIFMPNRSTPDWQPMSLDTEALLASDNAAHLYTMPGTGSVATALDLDEGLQSSACLRQTIQTMGTLPAKAEALSHIPWAVWLIAGGCQPLITSTKVLDVTRESESSKRSW